MINFVRHFFFLVIIAISGNAIANPLLSQIETLIGSAQTVRGKFVQTKSLSGISKRLTSEGSFIIDKGQGVLWITEKPIYQKLKVTSAGIKVENKNGTLMSLDARSEPSVKYINELILAIFSGDMATLERIFAYSGDISAKGWSLDLAPKSASLAPFKKIAISGTSVINRILFVSREGDTTEVIFTDIRPAAGLSKDETLQFQ